MILPKFEQLYQSILLLNLRLELLVFGLQVRDHSCFVLKVLLDLRVCLVLSLELVSELFDLVFCLLRLLNHADLFLQFGSWDLPALAHDVDDVLPE